MKTGLCITARLGSTRLKRKHLLMVDGQPILLYLLKRILTEFEHEVQCGDVVVMIATADEKENREFEGFNQYGVPVFYGATHNIPLRHLEAARQYELEHIIAIDGDDILCSPAGVRRVYEGLRAGKPYVKTTGLPFGMNSMGYSQAFLAESLAATDAHVLETGWGRIFDVRRVAEVQMPFAIQDELLRFTLDYQEDFDFFAALIQAVGAGIFTISDEDLAALALEKNFHMLNAKVAREYWDNFYGNVQAECAAE